MVLKGASLTEGLRTRLSSSLPLEARCRLAVNTFTCRVFIPHKEEVVLDWVLSRLEKKYRDKIDQPEDSALWTCLASCLQHSTQQGKVDYQFSRVPEFLLNVLPTADLLHPAVLTCLSPLLTLGCRDAKDSEGWPSILTILVKAINSGNGVEFIDAVLQSLSTLSLQPGQDTVGLLKQLSLLYMNCSPEQKSCLIKVVESILFCKDSVADYATLFRHLTGEEVKYRPGLQVSTLLECLMTGGDPALILAACPPQPPWLPLKLFSTLLFLADCPTLVSKESVVGGQLDQVPKLPGRAGDLLVLLLPVDLGVELTDGLSASKYIQSIVSHCAKSDSADLIVEVVAAVHKNHPQLLEPMLASLLVKHQECQDIEIFEYLFDMVLKLRQIPKLVSKLFLHLRTLDLKDLKWKKADVSLFGSTLASLPRVQSLEMWKTLNYHLASDCLNTVNSAHVTSTLLSPLLCTLFSHSQMADHNLPSSLRPRITDLVQKTLECLETLFNMSSLSESQQTLLYAVTLALSEFIDIYDAYRGGSDLNSLQSFQSKVTARILEDKKLMTMECAQKLVMFKEKQMIQIEGKFEECKDVLLKDPEHLVEIIDKVPDEFLLRLIQRPIICPRLYENGRFNALLLYASLEKINRRDENLCVPPVDIWTNAENWANLDSYLAKTLASGMQTLVHSEIPGGDLPLADSEVLALLPLENLPPTLKLGATLVCLSQVMNRTRPLDKSLLLAARCLETTDLFRYVDVGKFLLDILNLEGERKELLKVVSTGIGKFSKTIQDMNLHFQEFEEKSKDDEDSIEVAVNILGSLRSHIGGMEGTPKKILGQELAEKLLKYFTRNFKNNIDNKSMMNLLCRVAAELVAIFSKQGLGKTSKYIFKMIDLTFSEGYSSWKTLLQSICDNLEHLNEELLPEDWKSKAWFTLAENFDDSCVPLLMSLMKTADATELDSMLSLLPDKELLSLDLWTRIIQCPLDLKSTAVKKKATDKAVRAIMLQARNETLSCPELLPSFLTSIFSSSPPCVTPGLETLCLSCLVFLPQEMAPVCLKTVATFLSQRSTLSTRSIPLITSLVRHFMSPKTVSLDTIHSLQSLLGLFSRNKADWSSVIPYLLADLLNLHPKLPANLKSALTAAILPLVDSLDKHGSEYLSANLPVVTGELFKHVLSTHTTQHKFKGKV